MAQIAQILTDVDGTLVAPWSDVVSQAVQEAIKRALSRGVAVTLVTGRPFELAQPIIGSLGLTGLGIFDGGATIQDIDTGQIAWSKWIDTETVQAIIDIVGPASTMLDYQPGANEHMPYNKALAVAHEPSPGVLAIVPTVDSAGIEEQLLSISEVVCYAQPAHQELGDVVILQITHAEASKAHAVEKLLAIHTVDPRHTLAIVDGTNDIPLFKHAGIKVAMGNATDALKIAADYIVGDVDHDGFAEAVNKYLLS